jgi:hypothetical protein
LNLPPTSETPTTDPSEIGSIGQEPYIATGTVDEEPSVHSNCLNDSCYILEIDSLCVIELVIRLYSVEARN